MHLSLAGGGGVGRGATLTYLIKSCANLSWFLDTFFQFTQETLKGGQRREESHVLQNCITSQ